MGVVLAIARFASFASAGALAGALLVAPTANANGCIFPNFGGGTGTSSDPLLIATANHLNELKDDGNCWGYEFRQTADISMGGVTWTTSIGGNFTGTYNGSGYVISDLTIARTAYSYVGLFGTVTSTGAIRNLGFHGSVTGVSYVGGLAGVNEGTIENSFVGSASPVPSYNDLGGRDPYLEDIYLEAEPLEHYGFTGFIGPEPHGSNPLNSGSSGPGGRGRDEVYADLGVEQLEKLRSADKPWLLVTSFVNPHDITLWGSLTVAADISGA